MTYTIESIFIFIYMPAKTFSLFSQPYLDKINQCYMNIITINNMPMGPLKAFVTQIRMPPLSEFKQPSPCSPARQCVLGIRSMNRCGIITMDELPELMSYLVENNYTINKDVTNILRRSDTQGRETIAFVTYNS